MLLLLTALVFAPAPKQEINKEWLYDSVWLLQYTTVNTIVKFSKDGSFTSMTVKMGEIEEGFKGKWYIAEKRLILDFTTTPGGSKGTNTFTLNQIGKKLMVGKFTDGRKVQLVKVGLLEKEKP